MKRITDSFAFARDGQVLEGSLAVADLERLHDVLTGVDGEINFRIQGYKGARGESMLRVQVTGVLPLSCQRCLEAIHFSLDIDSALELVPEGAEMSQDELEDDSKDFLPVAGELNVAELVEDEVLLAVPFAPRHEMCGLPGEAESGERLGPFAGLSSIKGRLN